MRTRILSGVCLLVLIAPTLWAQEQSPAEQAAEARATATQAAARAPASWGQEESAADQAAAQAAVRAARARAAAEAFHARTASSDAEVQIYELEYQSPREMASTLGVLFSGGDARVALDERGNRLIVTSSAELLEKIRTIVSELDSPPWVAQTPQIVYRVYMLELPLGDQNLRSFSLVLEGSIELSATEFLDAVESAELQIAAVRQKNDNQTWPLLIQGRAASNEAIRSLVAQLPDTRINELQWEDDASTSSISAAQVTTLPAPLQDHVQRLLGGDAQTVGYWFGTLSVPGAVEAPIGPWVFEMAVDESGQTGEMECHITVVRETVGDPGARWQILSNSMQAKIDKPIIIGYNRDRYGERAMGAMVIVPDTEGVSAL